MNHFCCSFIILIGKYIAVLLIIKKNIQIPRLLNTMKYEQFKLWM